MSKSEDVSVSSDGLGRLAVCLRSRSGRILGFSLSPDAARELVEQLVEASNGTKSDV